MYDIEISVCGNCGEAMDEQETKCEGCGEVR